MKEDEEREKKSVLSLYLFVFVLDVVENQSQSQVDVTEATVVASLAKYFARAKPSAVRTEDTGVGRGLIHHISVVIAFTAWATMLSPSGL